MTWCYLDHTFLLEEKAYIPVTDRGFLFGDGIFTTLRVSRGQPEFLEAHLKRLYQQCEVLKIQPPVIEWSQIVELIQLNKAQEGIWRLKILITGGQESALRLPKRHFGHLFMSLKPYIAPSESTCRLTLFPEPVQRPIAALKTLSYLDRLVIQEYAFEKGYEDCLVQSPAGYLLETSFSNFFWFYGQQLFIPDPSLPLLQGIILTHLLEKAPYPVQFFKGGIESIPLSAFVYTCNSLAHFRPVIEIDGRFFERNKKFEEFLETYLISRI